MNDERLSAWVDGEADEIEAAGVLRKLAGDPDARSECAMAWLIGDVLRGSHPAGLGCDLTRSVMTALEREPVVLAPGRTVVPGQKRNLDRWLPAAAAVAGVAVAAWMSLSLIAPANNVVVSQPLAVATPPVSASASAPVQLVVGGEQAYYLAHQASTIGAPIGGVAQYIRTVGDEQTGTR